MGSRSQDAGARGSALTGRERQRALSILKRNLVRFDDLFVTNHTRSRRSPPWRKATRCCAVSSYRYSESTSTAATKIRLNRPSARPPG